MRGEGSGRSLRHWPCPAQGSSPREGRAAGQHLPKPTRHRRRTPGPGRPSPAGAGIAAQSCGLAPALWPEALGARVCLARSPLGKEERKTWACWAPTPQEGWPDLSKLDTGKHPDQYLGTRGDSGTPQPARLPQAPLNIPLLGDPPRATDPGAMLPPAPPRVAGPPSCAEEAEPVGTRGHSLLPCMSRPGLPVPVHPGARLPLARIPTSSPSTCWG